MVRVSTFLVANDIAIDDFGINGWLVLLLIMVAEAKDPLTIRFGLRVAGEDELDDLFEYVAMRDVMVSVVTRLTSSTNGFSD